MGLENGSDRVKTKLKVPERTSNVREDTFKLTFSL